VARKSIALRDRQIRLRWQRARTVVEIEAGAEDMTQEQIVDHILRDYLDRRQATIQVDD
jgi:methyl coenzyme M reductase subunit D